MPTIEFYGETINLAPKVSHYINGRTAITFSDQDTGEAFGCLTVNLGEEPLKEDEIFVKTWSENEPWVPQILKQMSEHFEDTGKRVDVGFTKASIWRIKKSLVPTPETPKNSELLKYADECEPPAKYTDEEESERPW